jgi:Rrf2 family nitric oxide-sensitive transcriptional repressor
MRLSLQTDYALRALIHLAASETGSVSAPAMARAYGISQNHLVKVLQRLGKLGYVGSVRGRGGGVRLTKAPEAIGVGEIVRQLESLAVVECFTPQNTCPIAPACRLAAGLGEAMEAYLAVLDRYTIADVTANRGELMRILGPVRRAC